MNSLEYVAFKRRLQEEVLIENTVFKTMDTLMQQCTMFDYCKAIELYFADLFHCERVNVILVHRIKKYLYRIEEDDKPGTFKFVKFELQHGLAGYVAIASTTVLTDSVPDEVKFNAQIDDPRAPENNPAMQMITCPISATDDFQQMNKEGLTNYPRAIVQLINKKHDFDAPKGRDEENKDA